MILSIARILRPLGTHAMSRVQAQRAGQLLKLHWTTVYRLRKRFLADQVATSLAPGVTGPAVGSRKLSSEVQAVVAGTLTKWLPRQREHGAPLSNLTMEIRRVLAGEGQAHPNELDAHATLGQLLRKSSRLRARRSMLCTTTVSPSRAKVSSESSSGRCVSFHHKGKDHEHRLCLH